MQDATVNILIARRLRPDAHEAFEQTVRDWIPRAVQFPGYLSVLMLRPGSHSDEYGAVLRFQTQQDWDKFQSWQDYKQFLESIRPMLADEPSVKPMHGLEAWFGPRDRMAPPRWKMALLTWIGVCAMVFVFSRLVQSVGEFWPWWVRFLLTNTLVVASLTWLVMPVLAKLSRSWLLADK